MDSALEGDLTRFARALESGLRGELVTLAAFGSQVTGRARAESDLDLLIVARGLPRRRSERSRLIGPIARGIGSRFAETVSWILLTPDEASSVKPFYLGFLEGHRLLIDREGFFAAVLDRLRKRLDELGARRLMDELGNPYWDLKPDYRLGENVIL